MFFYVCLILLPATALTLCNVNTIWDYFNVADANNDDGIDRNEANVLFQAVDLNKDNFITEREAQLTFSLIARPLIGKEKEVIAFLDLDGDGQISLADVDENYKRVDLDNNEIKSRDEYSKYLETRCGEV